MATWSGSSDCGTGNGPSDRILGADPSDDTRQRIELVALIIGAVAVPIVLLTWDRPTNSGSSGIPYAVLVAFTVALVGAQRFLYILTPHEFSTGNGTDVANLAVSGVAIALATVWAAYFVAKRGKDLPAAAEETSGDDGSTSPLTGERKSCCRGSLLYTACNACRYLARVAIVVAWLLDVQRRTGTVVYALGYASILALALVLMIGTIPHDPMRARVSYVLAFVGWLALFAVQILRPCRGY
jgi:hypothetical protein